MYRSIIKPLFFLLPAERAHYAAMALLRFACKIPGGKYVLRKMFASVNAQSKRTVFGITFENPVGLAAGFDKDARWVDELSALGFGFIEIGTLTPKAQPGNDQPRLFRLPKDAALINRMGFNNGGAAAAAERLSKRTSRVIVGGNIGKNKSTPNEQAVDDYLACFEALF
ncbi:MAG: dihydroorotate dehydrogenase (quinone), partial [Flavobacteriales bacterium]